MGGAQPAGLVVRVEADSVPKFKAALGAKLGLREGSVQVDLLDEDFEEYVAVLELSDIVEDECRIRVFGAPLEMLDSPRTSVRKKMATLQAERRALEQEKVRAARA